MPREAAHGFVEHAFQPRRRVTRSRRADGGTCGESSGPRGRLAALEAHDCDVARLYADFAAFLAGAAGAGVDFLPVSRVQSSTKADATKIDE